MRKNSAPTFYSIFNLCIIIFRRVTYWVNGYGAGLGRTRFRRGSGHEHGHGNTVLLRRGRPISSAVSTLYAAIYRNIPCIELKTPLLLVSIHPKLFRNLKVRQNLTLDNVLFSFWIGP